MQEPDEALGSVLRTRRKTPKTDEIAQALSQAVVDGQFRIGDLLMSENELAQRFGVSRPNIRQALHRLGAAGLVTTRHGVGSYVSPPERWNLFDPLLLEAFIRSGNLAAIAEELVELRKMVEVESAELAAASITPDELRELEAALTGMRLSIGDVDKVTEADLAFHDVIVQASRNRFFRSIMSFVREPLLRARQLTMASGGEVGQTRAFEHHRAIYEAIKEGDGAAASEAMRLHMKQLEEDMHRALLTP